MTGEEKSFTEDVLQSIEESTFEQISSGIKLVGGEILKAYKFGLLTPSQRKKLTDYKERHESKEREENDSKLIQDLKNLAMRFNIDTPTIFQKDLIDGRLIVCSYEEFLRDKKTHKRSMGPVYEIYRDSTPGAYEYALIKFKEYTPDFI